ncbi:MAG TPA: hypothetical protein VMZ92_21425, partial [Planctomycetota bacterium]|nr:hypothetical protein [Planctomycetota bacterium]
MNAAMLSRVWCAAVAVSIVLGVSAPLAAVDYHWQGAGTGTNTATSPSDNTTLWNNADNWQEAAVPGTSDTAYLAFDNAGYANAVNDIINYLYVDGSSSDGAFHVADGAYCEVNQYLYVGKTGLGTVVQAGDLKIYRGVYVGYDNNSVGTFRQSGGNHYITYLNGSLILGYNAGSQGHYELENGTLSVPNWVVVGSYGDGTFTQTGGT